MMGRVSMGQVSTSRCVHERTVRPVRPLWKCPRCGRTFANRSQNHSCRSLASLDDHFVDKPEWVRETFDRAVDAVTDLGPVSVLAEQTRIALHVRMSFAAFMPRSRWLAGHIVLARRIDSPRFHLVETYSPRNVLHAFRLTSPDDVDPEFVRWLREAYLVGAQEHLSR